MIVYRYWDGLPDAYKQLKDAIFDLLVSICEIANKAFERGFASCRFLTTAVMCFDYHKTYFSYRNKAAENPDFIKWLSAREPWRSELKPGDRVDVEITELVSGIGGSCCHKTRQWR